MKHYAGIDVSLEYSSVCVVDADGAIVREDKVSSEPEALIAWFAAFGAPMERIGLEAGPLSQWLHAGMSSAGLAVELLETRHVRAAFRTMPVKTDKKDARGIAQLMRLGWFRPVWCKSLAAQEVRAVLTARKLLQGKVHDVEMSLRGILRGFGLKVGATTPRTYTARVHALAQGHPTLEGVVEALLKAREVMAAELRAFERRVHAKRARTIAPGAWRSIRCRAIELDRQLVAAARRSPSCRVLMSIPGVGAVTAMSFAAAIEDPQNFKTSRSVGAWLGLTTRRYQSGEVDYDGHISRRGDKPLRALVYEAATVILTRSTAQSALRSWGLKLRERVGFKRAAVALARKLAVVMHSMLKTGEIFNPGAAAA